MEAPGAGSDEVLEMDDLELLRAYDENRYGMAMVARVCWFQMSLKV